MAPSDRSVFAVIALTGISALVTQLLIVRECIAQFFGNEFVIALILFSWLLLGGAGNRMSHFVHRRIWPATKARLAWLTLFLAAAPAFQIFAIRCLRDVFFIPGSDVGFYATFGYIFLCMAPYGLVVGIALPYALFVLTDLPSAGSGTRVYMADNLGNVVGGVLFTFVLVLLPGPSWAVFITSSLLIAGACLLFHKTPVRGGIYGAGAAVVLAVLFSGILLEKPSLAPVSGRLAYYKESRYGRITVHQSHELYTVFLDGNPVFSGGDVISAEEAVHFPLSQIDSPEAVLFVSAESGMLAEAEKYAPRTVDYVELNPDVTRTLFRVNLLQDRKKITRVIHQDPRRYLAVTDTVYDAVIVNLPDPTTFQVNRFFTDRFFALAKSRLAPGGIFSFSAPGYENYLSEPTRRKLSSLYNTASAYFSHVRLIPGGRVVFLCKDGPIDDRIAQALQRKGIPTQYISRYFPGNTPPERIDGLNRLMDGATPKNRDLSPHLIRLRILEWFSVHHTSPRVFIIGAAVLLLGYLFLIKQAEFVLFTTGFSAMGSEMLTIFAFQITFGYIYSQIGLIVSVFLAGLIPGAWIGHRWPWGKINLLQMVDGMFIVLLLAFAWTVGWEKPGVAPPFFYAFGFLISLGCGCQFPAAFRLMPDEDSTAPRLFSADLVGAAFGVLITSVLFIPWLGISGAAWGLIGMKLLSFASIARRRRKDFQTI